jgi:hypothetical protein
MPCLGYAWNECISALTVAALAHAYAHSNLHAQVVFDHAKRDRSIIYFSSFDADVCTMLSLKRKYQSPFLSMGVCTLSSSSPFFLFCVCVCVCVCVNRMAQSRATLCSS